MTTTDITAILAIVLSSGALLLEIRRWAESGVRLTLTVIADAVVIPADDGYSKLSLWVANVGAKPTTITNFSIQAYKSYLHRLVRKPSFTAIVGNPTSSPIPAKLGVGDRWNNQMYYTIETWKLRKDGQLFVGVFSTDRKSARLVKVAKPSKEEPVYRP